MTILKNKIIFYQKTFVWFKKSRTYWPALVKSKLDHPPQSPDLNVIELLWDFLKRKVKERRPTSKSRPKQVLTEEWHKIPAYYLCHYVYLKSSKPRVGRHPIEFLFLKFFLNSYVHFCSCSYERNFKFCFLYLIS